MRANTLEIMMILVNTEILIWRRFDKDSRDEASALVRIPCLSQGGYLCTISFRRYQFDFLQSMS